MIEIEQVPQKNKAAVFLKAIFVLASVFLIFWAGYLWGTKSENGKNENSPLSFLEKDTISSAPDDSVDLDLFWKVWNLVEDKFVDKSKLDKQKMIYGAIEGFLRSTGDPYTSFLDPEQTKSFSEDLEGSFEGIGAELGMRGGILTVIAPLDGSPAQKAGLKPNDKILKIDGQSSLDISIDEAVSKIRGPRGTQVILSIIREGEEEARDITVARDVINVSSVNLEFKENDIALLRISRFGEDTGKEFNRAVDEIISRKAKAVIIDLRNNPGGYLDQAVAVASQMLARDSVVLQEEDRDGKRETLRTVGGNRLGKLPAVVLLNEGSASASEILAGALRDDRDIKIVGKTSFGKGSVQDLTLLSDGSSVKITIAKWLTPKGEYIMEKGVKPDFEVDLTSEDIDKGADPQLDKAVELVL